MKVIADKITAPTGWPRVSRKRLLAAIEESASSGTSTILNGRAGTGKTTLAAEFAHRCGRQVAWYKVDALDADLRIFFEHFIETLNRVIPGFGADTVASLAATATIEDMPILAECIIWELLERNTPVLIVIDDLHHVYDTPWLGPFFGRLLPLLPAETHLLITGRSLPPAPLWRLRSKQTLAVLDEALLAFTQEETLMLFASYGLPPDQVHSVLNQTRGRPCLVDAAARTILLCGHRPLPGSAPTTILGHTL